MVQGASAVHVDIHQHIWTEPLLEALRERRRFPFVRSENGLTVLHCAGEQPYVIDVEAERPERRERLVREDGLDLAVVTVSSPIGIEALPRAESTQLIEAYLAGVRDLGDAFACWGPIPLDQPDPDDVDSVLDKGCVGVSLPADALAGFDRLDHVGPMLERVAARGAPLLVHPGPATTTSRPGHRLAEPLWWPAMTDYVSQMNAAWLTFVAVGRRDHPSLVAVFAMLAAGAPMQVERLAARGGPPLDVRDPLVFYDTSSHGTVAIGAMAKHVGADRLVYGSDRPVVEPVSTGWESRLQINAGQLLAQRAVATA
jgi:6-methylsalicylate decarboxylase